jgi:subtilisin-like proprotein convertase family protein
LHSPQSQIFAESGYTGAGVNVGVIEVFDTSNAYINLTGTYLSTGTTLTVSWQNPLDPVSSGYVNFANPDLAPNEGAEYQGSGVPGVALVGAALHSSTVAAVLGGAGDGDGVSGVAPNATLYSEPVNISGTQFQPVSTTTNSILFAAWLPNLVAGSTEPGYGVVNDSWGFQGPIFEATSYTALYDAATMGRGGKGTVVVMAAGNTRTDNTNDSQLDNSPYEITVGGILAPGDTEPKFTTPGASVLVSAPASEIVTSGPNDPGIYLLTVSSQPVVASYSGYVSGAGTSFAAPIVSGVVALMLQANPNLTYEDVQQILAYSAVMVDPTDSTPYSPFYSTGSDWSVNGATNWNGGGLYTSPDYGFGEVDALAAVNLAATWKAGSAILTATASSIASVDFSHGIDFGSNDFSGIPTNVVTTGSVVLNGTIAETGTIDQTFANGGTVNEAYSYHLVPASGTNAAYWSLTGTVYSGTPGNGDPTIIDIYDLTTGQISEQHVFLPDEQLSIADYDITNTTTYYSVTNLWFSPDGGTSNSNDHLISTTYAERNGTTVIETFGSVQTVGTISTYVSLTTPTTQTLDVAGTLDGSWVVNTVSSTLTVPSADNGQQADFVQVSVDLQNVTLNGLTITLISPTGTESVLMDGPAEQTGLGTQSDFSYTFGTNEDRGELINGTWTLSVTDATPFDYNAILNSWSLTFTDSPAVTTSTGQTYIYTESYGTLTTGNVFTGSGYADTLNAAAVETGATIDLNAGSTDSMIAGRALTIAAGATITTAIVGDEGNGTLIANSYNDTLEGLQGDTYVLNSGFGQDLIENGTSVNAGPSGQLEFGSGLGASNLWFTQSGSNLAIAVLDTTSTVTVSNWFAGTATNYAQLGTVSWAGGSQLNIAAISQLTSLDAAYQSAHPSFNPQTATVSPFNVAGTVVGLGTDFLGAGGTDFFVIDSSGNFDVDEFSNSGTIIASQSESDGQFTTSGTSAYASFDVNGRTAVISGSAYVFGVNGNSDTLTFGAGSSSDQLVLSGSLDIGSIGSGSTAYAVGSSDTITATAGATAILSASGDVANVSGSGAVGYETGSNETATASGSSELVLMGSLDVGTVGSGSAAWAHGSSDTVTATAGGTAVLTASGDVANVSGSGAIAYENGSDETGTGSSSAMLELSGSLNVGIVSSGAAAWAYTSSDTITATAGGTAVLTASGDVAIVSGSGASGYETGSDETGTASSSAVLYLTGILSVGTVNSGGTAWAYGSTDTITVNAGGTAILAASGDGASVSGSGAIAYETGTNETATANGGGEIVLDGSLNTGTLTAGGSSWEAGTGNTITATGSGAVVSFGGTLDTAIVSLGAVAWDGASGNTVILGSGGEAALDGTSTNATIGGSGSIVNVGTASSVTLAPQNSLTIAAGTSLTASLANSGTIDVTSGTLVFQQAVSNSATFLLGGTATVDFVGTVTSGSSMQFLQSGGTLETQATGLFGAAVSGFAAGETIDAAAVLFALTPTLQFTGGTLTVSDGTHSAAFGLVGTYLASSFTLTSDGHNGTAITY